MLMRKSRRRQKRFLSYVFAYFFFAGIAATVVLIALLILSIFGYEVTFGREMTGGESEFFRIESDVTTKWTAVGQSGGETSEELNSGVLPDLSEIPSDKSDLDSDLLVLVNKEHPIAADYAPNLRKICKGRLEASEYLYDDLCAMLKAAADSGYEYWISSGYRSEEYQRELIEDDIASYREKGYSYDEAVSRTYEYTMPVGSSEHHTGLALDILCSTNIEMDESQADEPGNAWLCEHCWEYGFILRYPPGREEITGIQYEPWHFRYVGKDVAEYIMKNELVLEEYISYVAGQ